MANLNSLPNPCPHDDDPLSCPPCVNKRAKVGPYREKVEYSFPFAARYDSQCGECDLPILVGQLVVMKNTTKGHTQQGQAIHEGCI